MKVRNGNYLQSRNSYALHSNFIDRSPAAAIVGPDIGHEQMTAVSPAAIECLIRAEPAKDFLRLEAVVRSNAPVAGRYSFVIAKLSSTGTSSNVQSGTFALSEEPEHVISTVLLDRSAIEHYRAELSIQSDHGRFECTSP